MLLIASCSLLLFVVCRVLLFVVVCGGLWLSSFVVVVCVLCAICWVLWFVVGARWLVFYRIVCVYVCSLSLVDAYLLLLLFVAC